MKSKPFLIVGAVGLLFLFLGASFIIVLKVLPTSVDPSCRAICGLGLLFSTFFGPEVGSYLIGLIWSAIGISLLAAVYRLSR